MVIICPICKKTILEAAEDYPSRPFCSARCKLADLHNWLNEVYRIPGEPAELEGCGTKDVDDERR